MNTDEDRLYYEQVAIFERLYARIEPLFDRIGRPDTLLGVGDYSIYSDYWGYPQVKVSIGKLEYLAPDFVAGLQNVLKEFPGWEIIVAVALQDHLYDWPDMWLVVREHQIIDELQRQYFPKEFQDLSY